MILSWGLLGVWAILGCVPFVFSIKETILPSLPLVLVSISVPALANSLVFGLFLRHAVWACLRWLLPLLAISLLFYVKDLLALPLLWLQLALASVALLGVSTAALEPLALVLFFKPSTEVIVRFAILLKFAIKVFDGPWLFPS